jgi:hypothetical protein
MFRTSWSCMWDYNQQKCEVILNTRSHINKAWPFNSHLTTIRFPPPPHEPTKNESKGKSRVLIHSPNARWRYIRPHILRRASTSKVLARVNDDFQVRIWYHSPFLGCQGMRCPDNIPDLKQEPISIWIHNLYEISTYLAAIKLVPCKVFKVLVTVVCFPLWPWLRCCYESQLWLNLEWETGEIHVLVLG